MGVLRVNDGTALLPDWRNVGCGGSAGTTVTDNFNRANSTTTLGAGWTVVTREGVVGHWGIDTNRAYCVDSPVSGSSTFWQTLAVRSDVGADFDMTVTIATAPGNGALLAWRVSVAADDGSFGLGYFLLTATSGVVRLLSGASGGTNVASGTTFVSGDVVRVVAVGSSHSVYQNGTLVYSFTDTNLLTETWHGLAGRDPALGTNPRLDSFSLSSSPMVTGRLKLWDGTRWMREVCDNDPSSTITDNANRTNSTTTPNPCSDGGAWTVKGGPWGVNTNRLYPVTRSGGSPVISGAWDAIMRDTGLAAADVTVTNTMTAAGIPALNGIVFASNAAGSDCLYVSWDGTGNSGGFGVFSWNGTVQSTIGTQFSIGTPWANTGSGPVIRVTYVPATGVVNVYKNGTLMGSRTYTGSAKTGTWVGPIVNRLGASGDLYTFDDFSAVAAPERHPLKMWDGTTWQTVACMTPA